MVIELVEHDGAIESQDWTGTSGEKRFFKVFQRCQFLNEVTQRVSETNFLGYENTRCWKIFEVIRSFFHGLDGENERKMCFTCELCTLKYIRRRGTTRNDFVNDTHRTIRSQTSKA
jgi:hypothetical protein